MKYNEIKEIVLTSDGIEKLLHKLENEQFACIDYHLSQFKNGAMSEGAQLNATIEELTGVFGDLVNIFSVVQTIQENQENEYYCRRKLELEKEDKKFVSSVVEREAKNHVAFLRVLTNTLEGRINACEKAISTCQSRIKFLASEITLGR
jgi:hypothetical protein